MNPNYKSWKRWKMSFKAKITTNNMNYLSNQMQPKKKEL